MLHWTALETASGDDPLSDEIGGESAMDPILRGEKYIR